MLLLITSNVRFAATSISVYESLFERHDVAARTEITREGLRDVGQQIQGYFGSDTEPLRVRATVAGVERDLFGTDEVSHMADVKELFLRTFRVQRASGLFVAVVTAIAVYSFRSAVLAVLAVWLRRGSVFTAGVIAVLGIGSLVAFGPLFALFHSLGFPQGNFQFDPRTDYLVRVFPFGFWRDITLLIGFMTLLEAAVLFGVAYAFRRLAARARGAAPTSAAPPGQPTG
jgi:integral membrane protein (TIGR01906 family)